MIMVTTIERVSHSLAAAATVTARSVILTGMLPVRFFAFTGTLLNEMCSAARARLSVKSKLSADAAGRLRDFTAGQRSSCAGPDLN